MWLFICIWIEIIEAIIRDPCPLTYSQVQLTCQYWFDAVVLNSGLRVKAKAQNICHKKTCLQKVLIFKKRRKESAHHLDSNPWPPKCKSVALPIELSVLWFSMECCSNFLQLSSSSSWSPHWFTVTNLKEEDDAFLMLSSRYGDVNSQRDRISALYYYRRRLALIPALRAGLSQQNNKLIMLYKYTEHMHVTQLGELVS